MASFFIELPVSSGGGGGGGNVNITEVGGASINLGSTTSANSFPVVIASDQAPIPITGTISATNPSVGATGSTIPVDATYIGGLNGGNLVGMAVDASGHMLAAQSGTWNITNVSGTVSLPTGASTAAKQPALGTAGSSSADVLTVQGITSMTALKVDGTGGTFPISGTVAATQSGTWNITNVSGTVSLPTGASTSALQTTGNTSLASIDTKTPALGQAVKASSSPVVIASDQALTASLVPAASGGNSMFRLLSLASTNSNNIKGSAGQLYGYTIANTNASPRWLKFYNKATAPTVGTDTPFMTILIPGNASGAGANVSWPNGIAMGTGIGVGITTGVADNDTGAVGASEVVLNILYT